MFNRSHTSAILLTALLIVWQASSLPAQTIDRSLGVTEIVSGLSAPLFVSAPPGDTSRIFIIEAAGRIRIVKNGALLGIPFLNIDQKICDSAESGLLGMAFHPQYATNGYIFVLYNDLNCDLRIARFTRSASNPDVASLSSEKLILFIDQPEFPNHNGGSLLFGPNDGYLYIPTGDGTCCSDPYETAQDMTDLRGKVLRIDINSGSAPYKIPPTNPFVGTSARPEIWGSGLRNPYRSTFDSQTGNLYLSDVGQFYWEEVNVTMAGDPGGHNYGWPIMEATHCWQPPDNCDRTGKTLPIHEFPHDPYCAVIGGNVYRGCAMPWLDGRYFFSDFCTGTVWSMRHNGTQVTEIAEHDLGIFIPPADIVGFGEDGRGEMYLCLRQSGIVYRFIPVDNPPQSCNSGSCCRAQVGNIDCDATDAVDISDINILINFLFIDSTPLCCEEEGNINGDEYVDIGDLTILVDHLFISGDPLPNCH